VTGLKCQACGRHWAMQTRHPDKFEIIGKFCPPCVARALPLARFRR